MSIRDILKFINDYYIHYILIGGIAFIALFILIKTFKEKRKLSEFTLPKLKEEKVEYKSAFFIKKNPKMTFANDSKIRQSMHCEDNSNFDELVDIEPLEKFTTQQTTESTLEDFDDMVNSL